MITTNTKKLLLTTSEDRDVIIAEVPKNHKPDLGKEYFISRDTLNANLKNNNFKSISDQVDWEGGIWMLSDDMN